MKNYDEILTNARKALAEKYLFKPRHPRLSTWHFSVSGTAFEVILASRRRIYDEAEFVHRAEKSLKDMSALSAELDRGRWKGCMSAREWQAEVAAWAETATWLANGRRRASRL